MNIDNLDPVKTESEIAKNTTDALVNATKVIDYFRKTFGLGPTIIEAHQKIIEEYVKSPNHTSEEKICFVSTYKKKVKKLQNCQEVINKGLDGIRPDADVSKLDEDFFTFFFDKAEKITNQTIQAALGKIMREEINNPNTINRSLVQTLSIIGKKQLESFCEISKFCLNEFHSDLIHIFIYISDAPKSYERFNITWRKLKELERLGLIVCDSSVGFAIDGDRELTKGTRIMQVTADKNRKIPTGNVVFTEDGLMLYNLIENSYKAYSSDVFDFIAQQLQLKGCNTWVSDSTQR